MPMMNIKHYAVFGIPEALYGMRNPLKSWDKSDTVIYTLEKAGIITEDGDEDYIIYENKYTLSEYINSESLIGVPVSRFVVGDNDKKLAKQLINAGTDHSKFMRQITTSIQIQAPMTWWWDFDTYKVATTRNSTSRMHTLMNRRFEWDDFGWDRVIPEDTLILRNMILDSLNMRRNQWKDIVATSGASHPDAKALWRSIIDDLPESYLFESTWTGSYQTLRGMYHSREGHKQVEFDILRQYIADNFPCSEFITT